MLIECPAPRRERPAPRLTILPALALLLPAAPLAAQSRVAFTATPAIAVGFPAGTMAGYLGAAAGIALGIRRGEGVVRLRGDLTWMHFGSRSISRAYNGTGPAIGITSSANVMLAMGGPELSLRRGRMRAALGIEGGAAHVLATGSTVLPGDPAQVNRSNTYATLTWAAKARTAVSLRVGRRMDIVVEGAVVQLGKTEFLREYNLPIGVISGIYLNPAPYKPTFVYISAGLAVPL